MLNGQFAGVVASPLTGLVRGLGSMIQGLALQLGQIAEKGLVTGEAPAAEAGRGAPRRRTAAEAAGRGARRDPPRRRRREEPAAERGAGRRACRGGRADETPAAETEDAERRFETSDD